MRIQPRADDPLMQSTLRPMRPEEMARFRPSGRVRMFWGAPFLLATIYAGSAALVSQLVAEAAGFSKQTVNRIAGVVALATLAGAFAHLFGKELRYEKDYKARERRRYAADLAAQQVEEWRVRVVDAIDVEEFEDEGRNCYLELEDGRVLFLSGQYLYDSDEDDTTPRFPNRDLLITRLPHAGDVLDVERLGEHFPPSVTLPPFTREDHENDRVPEDGQILPGPLSRYVTR